MMSQGPRRGLWREPDGTQVPAAPWGDTLMGELRQLAGFLTKRLLSLEMHRGRRRSGDTRVGFRRFATDATRFTDPQTPFVWDTLVWMQFWETNDLNQDSANAFVDMAGLSPKL